MANKQLRKRHDRKKPRRNPSFPQPGRILNASYVVDGDDSYYVVNGNFVNKVDCGKVVEMRKNEKGEWEK